jgi:hypothetical protein
MRDTAVADCARDSAKPPQAYVANAFDFTALTLRDGARMTVAAATDPCLALGQSTRIMIFERTSAGYRRVLNDVSVPGLQSVSGDGTVTLPTHDSMEVMFEATYVWNGRAYVFSGPRSHRYDLALDERRPAEIPVTLVPGAYATTLSGNVAYNFGDEYVFEARAGQKLTIHLTKYAGTHPSISLYYRDDISAIAEIRTTSGWSGTLPKTGTYRLFVDGTDESDATRRSTYTIRLLPAKCSARNGSEHFPAISVACARSRAF